MLVLRHEAAFVADHGPAVLLGFGEGGVRGNEGFDGHPQILPLQGIPQPFLGQLRVGIPSYFGCDILT